MPKQAVSSPAPTAPGPIKITETREQVIPSGVAPTNPAAPAHREKKTALSDWFASLDADERVNLWWYYIERMDANVQVVREPFEGARGGKYLYRLNASEVSELSQGAFEQELKRFISERFGGGVFRLLATHKKITNRMRNDLLEIEGSPILSEREGYADGRGQQPRGGQSGEATLLPMLMKVIDDKLSMVTSGRQDASSAVGDVAKAVMESNSQAFKWAMENTPKSADPATQLQQMKFMFDMVKDMFDKREPAAPAMNPMEQFTQFATLFKTVRDLDAKPAQEGGNIQEIVRTAVSTALQSSRPRGGGGTDWGAFIGQALTSPAVGNFLMAGAQWLRSKVQAGATAEKPPVVIQRGGKAPFVRPGAGPAPAAQPSPLPGNRLQPRPMRGQEPDTPQGEAATPDETAPAGTPAEQIEITQEVAQAVLFEYVAHQIVDLFKHDNPGNEVAGAIDRMFPELSVQMRFMNEDLLRAFITNNPTLAEIKDDPRLPKFLKEFVGYFQQLGMDFEETEEQEAS